MPPAPRILWFQPLKEFCIILIRLSKTIAIKLIWTSEKTMIVKKIDAAKMVGVSKATFYNHIKSKSISIQADGKVDISELQRVYGHDNVKTLEQREKEKTEKSKVLTSSEDAYKDKIERLATELKKEQEERRRERDFLTTQLDNLNETLRDSLNQNKELTRAITDQRTEAEKIKTRKEEEQSAKIDSVLEKIAQMEERKQKKSKWWPFGN
jgi:AcrR family transcriptional regulator